MGKKTSLDLAEETKNMISTLGVDRIVVALGHKSDTIVVLLSSLLQKCLGGDVKIGVHHTFLS